MECAKCGREASPERVSEWIAATRLMIDAVPVSGTAYEVKYRYRGSPFVLALCDECYWAASRRYAWQVSIWLFLLMAFIGTPILLGIWFAPEAGWAAWAALVMLAGFWILTLGGLGAWHLRQRRRVENRNIIYEMTRSLAKARMRALKCDWLFTPPEWKTLK